MKRIQIRTGHDADRLVVELSVGLHPGGLEAITESGIELLQHGQPLLHQFGSGLAFGVLQPGVGIKDWQGRITGREESVAVLRLPIDADAGRQSRMTGAFEMHGPSADIGMLDCPPLS